MARPNSPAASFREHEVCGHGVSLYRGPACRECDIVWHTEMLASAKRAVAKHEKALLQLEQAA